MSAAAVTSQSVLPSTQPTQPNPPHHTFTRGFDLFAHLPQNPDWTMGGYKHIQAMNTVESVIALTESMPDEFIKTCMLFIMKRGIMPIYEVPENESGGCFSYRVPNKLVCQSWRGLTYALIGETISTNAEFNRAITGITISPKKNFCIIKIWMGNCKYQNPALITIPDIPGIISQGCLFKKHM